MIAIMLSYEPIFKRGLLSHHMYIYSNLMKFLGATTNYFDIVSH